MRRGDVCTLAAAEEIGTKLHSASQTLGSRPALSLTFSRLLPLFWAGANLATCRLRLCMKLWPKKHPPGVSELELATFTLADRVRLFEARGFSTFGGASHRELAHCSLLARVPSGVLASLALCLASDVVRDRPLSLESTPSRIGSSAWFLSCSVWVSFLLSGAR